MNKQILQEATVVSQDAQRIHLRIHCQSACAGCHAKGSCNAQDQSEKELTLPCPSDQHYEVGETVWIRMHRRMGLQAVLWAYFLPFLLFVFILLICYQLTENEIVAALFATIALGVYYFFLYLMRTKLSNSFTFVLQKMNTHV